MRYIRTKDDKIFLIHEDLEIKDLWYFENREKILVISCNPGDLGKTADTIEELCDEFVLINSKIWVLGGYNQFESKKDAEWDYKNAIRLWKISKIPNKALYGAIWTDKGLIYVAKMNSKGELELL